MDAFNELHALLAAVLGPQAADQAIDALKASGVSPDEIAASAPMEELAQLSPAQRQALIAQLTQMMTNTEAINWTMGESLAHQKASQGEDAIITAAQAQEVRHALQVADLWLDTATVFMPAPGARQAWRRNEWVDHSLAVWKDLAAPIADAASQALASALDQRTGGFVASAPGTDPSGDGAQQAMNGVMRSMAGTAFGLQLGQAVGELSTSVLASTDVALPLAATQGTALIPRNIEEFARDLDVASADVLAYLAIREAAAARLLAHVPWLRGQLLSAVEAFASDIEIDMRAVDEVALQIDPSDPSSLQEAFASGLLAPRDTQAQREIRTRIETLLALIEGWVEVVTEQVCAAHLPQAMPLGEMMRRRRLTGGPADQILSRLIGLDFRPRLVREAASLWRTVGMQAGMEERDALWQHPDVMPQAADLADPAGFLTLRNAAADMDSAMDADLASLLEGTLGYEGDAKSE